MTDYPNYIKTPAEIAADIDRSLAEAAAFRAQARKDEAEALKYEAESRIASEALRAQVAASDVATLAAEEQLQSWREANHRDFDHGVFRFDTGVDENSVGRMISHMSLYSRLHPGTDIEIIFNSPGGNVFHGMALFDFIGELRAKGHHVTTHTRGMAASMAGILLQAGDTRVMGREAHILIHEISTLGLGKVSEIADEVEFMKRIQKRIIDIFVKRSGGKITADKIRRNWTKTDWWLSSDEALALGLVDEVRA